MSKEKWGKVLIIGDTMVDVYIDVDVRGISPEALCYDVIPKLPREVYLGGAGNIYRQLVKLGTPCMLMTAIGCHSNLINVDFTQVFNSFNTKMYPIMRTVVGTRKLTTKIRFMSDNQQIFRISDENSDDMEYKDIAPLLAIAENIIDEFDVVLLVDYNKGMMIPKLISQVIKVAKEKGVGVISDIKYRNVGYYEGSLIIKCNHKEYEAITYRPSSKYWIVTHGKAPTLMIHGGAQLKIDTIGNPYFKNSNCAGDIYMAGFVNSFVNTIQTDFKGQESACIHYSIKQGNKLASKSLSKVKDKVV